MLFQVKIKFRVITFFEKPPFIDPTGVLNLKSIVKCVQSADKQGEKPHAREYRKHGFGI
jgi:hypothetical protein